MQNAKHIEEFWAKVDKSGDCWLWQGRPGSHGYGEFARQRVRYLPHRLAYQLTHGKIPDGLVIDHMCHVRLCVNPAHLRAVTQLQNCENRGAQLKRNKSGHRGVSWDKKNQKWLVQVHHNWKSHWVGRFESLEDAAAAADAKRAELYLALPGDFTHTIRPKA